MNCFQTHELSLDLRYGIRASCYNYNCICYSKYKCKTPTFCLNFALFGKVIKIAKQVSYYRKQIVFNILQTSSNLMALKAVFNY